ncbi:MAG: transketolase [Rickettsiaceae bacterium]|nr:transketolase [Rickettsiaceae bacterium]
MKNQEKQNHSLEKMSDCIRILSADAVEAAKSGHPGMPLGFALPMTSLAFEFLKFNPNDPKWFNRDRLILSAGHGSMLLYSFFYLSGYKDFSLDDIKNFRQLNSKAAGHPEHELFSAIETTTGPLGQGIATAVGMAIAEKKYKAELGEDICNHKIYAIVGDGCLMEGISYEAASLAGHLKLNNLIVLFDDNNITIDGSSKLSVSEDHLSKFTAMGFNTVSIDGSDASQIRKALSDAQNSDKPSFIACKTVIGQGAKEKAGSAKSHGAPLGSEEIKYLKSNIDFAGEEFHIDPVLKEAWENSWKKSEAEYTSWKKNFSELPDEKRAYLSAPKLDIDTIFSSDKADKPEATRVSSGRIVETLMRSTSKVISGSADLAGSNSLQNAECKDITSEDFSGNFMRYGVRENVMSAVMNGLALSGFIPVGGTFFVFSDYMRPSIRLSALMGLQVIYVMTHDSIGVGEDGPTHQPIEHLASFRAMPNIDVFRPADFVETKECYEIALSNANNPSIMALSRQSLPQIRKVEENNLSSKGGYIISEASDSSNIDVTIFATGSEVSLAMEVQENMASEGKSVRVCSVPSMDVLHRQGREYLKDLKGNSKLVVAIEAASSFGWHGIIGSEGMFFGIDSFGASAPAGDLYKHFGLTKEKITTDILKALK